MDDKADARVADMTQFQSTEGLPDPIQFTSLNTLAIPASAVVIMDKALPSSLSSCFPHALLVEAGEGLKTLSAMENLALRVLEVHSSRPLIIVAVGGGTIGDAVGFLASILWRGVELWHIPTTLLAMVDSAHGGKTAVNLGEAKNQLGTFYPASQVIIADECLTHLPLTQRESGLVELLKALWLGDKEGLDVWDSLGADVLCTLPYREVKSGIQDLLQRAIDVKASIVAQDPKETREIRTFLNFGHTVAHALELSMNLSHGHAVAWGMASAAVVSRELGELTDRDFTRLFTQLYPLLEPIRLPDEHEFRTLLLRDKKIRNNELRSVILDGPGKPRVVSVPPTTWYQALKRAITIWEDAPIRIQRRTLIPAQVELESSKSELNRLLVMHHLEPKLCIKGSSSADDVVFLRSALVDLESGTVFAASGGTTLRFLIAVAATRRGVTRILANPDLLRRPHTSLTDALIKAGAQITAIEGGFEVRGWEEFPQALEVNAAVSSQPASAIALLSILGVPFSLTLRGELASPGYFEMTLSLLEQAGVELTREDGKVRFLGASPNTTLLAATPDASSAALWSVFQRLGLDVTFEKGSGLQPDSAIELALNEAERGQVSAALRPDLIPILAAFSLVQGQPLSVGDAQNLKHKESDRIEDLAEMLQSAGAQTKTSTDTLHMEPGELPETIEVATHGDHRLGFAAAVLSASGAIVEVDAPWVVRKSYPDFWRDLRRCGWSIDPLFGPQSVNIHEDT